MVEVSHTAEKTIVLVHAGFVDGSGWEDVYRILKKDGFLFLDKAKFPSSDVEEEKAAFMADSQVPWGVEALGGTINEPAWKTRPSWYLVATDDRMIPPPARRFMSNRAGATVVEVAGSHAIYVSQPHAVAALIEQAVKGVEVAAN